MTAQAGALRFIIYCSDIDWEDPEFIKQVAALYLGSANVAGKAVSNIPVSILEGVIGSFYMYMIFSCFCIQIRFCQILYEIISCVGWDPGCILRSN